MRIHKSIILLALLCSNGSIAQNVPPLINYQGRLANPDGSFLATANYTLTFRVYDATNGGTLVWGPQIFDGSFTTGHGPQIPVVNGFFNAMLGPVDTNGVSLANAFAGSNRFVEITVTNHAPVAPRQQILTAPFAFNSAKLAGADWSAVFGTNDPVNGKIPNSKIGVGSISITNLAERQTGTNVGVGGVAINTTGTNAAWSSPTPATSTAVPGLNVSISTIGRPVIISLTADLADSGSSGTYIQASRPSGSPDLSVVLFRDNVEVGREYVLQPGISATLVVSPSAFQFTDLPPSTTSGTLHSYQIKVYGQSGTSLLLINSVRIMAFEL